MQCVTAAKLFGNLCPIMLHKAWAKRTFLSLTTTNGPGSLSAWLSNNRLTISIFMERGTLLHTLQNLFFALCEGEVVERFHF